MIDFLQYLFCGDSKIRTTAARVSIKTYNLNRQFTKNYYENIEKVEKNDFIDLYRYFPSHSHLTFFML